MLDQPVPNPLAKNPNFFTHKVFAAIGIILIVAITAVAGIWWYVDGRYSKNYNENEAYKTSTDSAEKTNTYTISSSEKKDETADWKTYSKEVLGFSIKYPNDWTFVETPFDQGVTFQTDNFVNSGGSVTSGQFFGIYIQKNEDRRPIDSWWSDEGDGDYFVSEKKSIKVDGHEAIEYKVTGIGSYYGALIDNSNTVYIIDIGSTAELRQETIAIFGKMLSTFKFL